MGLVRETIVLFPHPLNAYMSYATFTMSFAGFLKDGPILFTFRHLKLGFRLYWNSPCNALLLIKSYQITRCILRSHLLPAPGAWQKHFGPPFKYPRHTVTDLRRHGYSTIQLFWKIQKFFKYCQVYQNRQIRFLTSFSVPPSFVIMFPTWQNVSTSFIIEPYGTKGIQLQMLKNVMRSN